MKAILMKGGSVADGQQGTVSRADVLVRDGRIAAVGEGLPAAGAETLDRLVKNGQIATQYVDLEGNPTSNIRFNPNNSVQAIEGITSPDGRVFGKMGHSERYGENLYKNVPDKMLQNLIFQGAVDYYK